MTHVFREVNCCSNRLARMGAELNSSFQFLYNLPDVMVDLLARVKAGFVCCNRSIVLILSVAYQKKKIQSNYWRKQSKGPK